MKVRKDNYVNYLSAQFKLGGRSDKEMDCYGLLIKLYALEGVTLPNYVTPSNRITIDELMRNKLKSVWEPCEDEAGALVHIQVPRVFSHVGMSYGDGTFVHMWEGSKVVELQNIDQWSNRIKGLYRFVG